MAAFLLSILPVLTVLLIIVVIMLLVANVLVSGHFFDELIRRYPDRKASLGRVWWRGEGGPIHPARQEYLKQHRYRELPDADLRAWGLWSWRLFLAYAATFTAFILCAVTWKVLTQI